MSASTGKMRLSVAVCVMVAGGCAVYGIVGAQTSEEPGWTAKGQTKALRGTVRTSTEQLYAERDIAREISRIDRIPQVAEKPVADAGDVLPKGMSAEKMRATQARMSRLYASQNIPNEIMRLDKSSPFVAAESK